MNLPFAVPLHVPNACGSLRETGMPAQKACAAADPLHGVFSDEASVAAAASGFAAVEGIARREMIALRIDRLGCLGFHCFDLPDGKKFICYPLDGAMLEINSND